MVKMAVFHQIWTSEGPNVVKIMRAHVSDHFPVTFPGGKFWYHGEKKLAHFWGLRGAFGHFLVMWSFFFTKNKFSNPVCFAVEKYIKMWSFLAQTYPLVTNSDRTRGVHAQSLYIFGVCDPPPGPHRPFTSR